MIPGFAAVIVDYRVRSAQPGDEPRRQRCQKKRPIRSRENMCDLNVLQTPPQRNQIYRFAHQRAKKRNTLNPPKPPRKRRINRNELRLNCRIISPIAQQKLGLYRLSADIALRRAYNRDLNTAASSRRCAKRPLSSWTPV